MYAATAISAETEEDVYTWTGQDEFDKLNDRVDAPPLPLPPIKTAKRVALVRHGQSTWNAKVVCRQLQPIIPDQERRVSSRDHSSAGELFRGSSFNMKGFYRSVL